MELVATRLKSIRANDLIRNFVSEGVDMFDYGQDAFKQLKNILAENTSPVYLWVGAGLSIEAGLPGWSELRERMILRGRRIIGKLEDSKEKEHRLILLDLAEKDPCLWRAFSRVHEALGVTEYRQSLVAEFSVANGCAVPKLYPQLFRLNIKGIITTNIDKLVTRAWIEAGIRIAPVEFNGHECCDYSHVLTSSKFFILHLHGFLDNINSLVMRQEELDKLQNDEGYRRFVQTLFYDRTIVFVGVNPRDESVVFHLDVVRNLCPASPIFWITDDNSVEAYNFADKYGIRRICYSSKNNHRELQDIIDALYKAKSYDEENPKPGFFNVPKVKKSTRNLSEIDWRFVTSEDARDILNKKAVEILRTQDDNGYKNYNEFLQKYKQQIHNAWYVDEGTRLLGWTIGKEIGDGAFGRVFEAIDDAGNRCAIKILKIDVMRKDVCLQSFRRGVRAMEILSSKGIEGVVKYKFASEIPALVAMEYVDGATLSDVVRQKQLTSWRDKMRVLTSVCSIIKSAHALPERVLHRDIRPQNIILRGFDYISDEWSVCVLDFDLAFHKGSNEVSIQMASGVNGFIAPEQTAVDRKTAQTRSCRVDSYGFAMLCYFVITGNEPRPDQCLQKGWKEDILKFVGGRSCNEWESLPIRMAELIAKCSEYEQSKRLDFYQIYDILRVLDLALKAPADVKYPDALLYELGARIKNRVSGGAVDYMVEDGRVFISRVDGVEYHLRLEKSTVYIEVNWHNNGHVSFSAVKKTLREKSYSFVGKLRASCLSEPSHRFEGSGVLIEASYDCVAFRDKLLHVAQLLSEADIAPKVY